MLVVVKIFCFSIIIIFVRLNKYSTLNIMRASFSFDYFFLEKQKFCVCFFYLNLQSTTFAVKLYLLESGERERERN